MTDLHRIGLKETLPRRRVVEALESIDTPMSPYDLQRWLASKKMAMNIVTIYRVLDAFEKAHLVHKHPCSGAYSLCSIPDKKGHHGFLHCTSCNRSTEYIDERLCAIENQIAHEAHFRPALHVSEVVGLCSSCH